MPKQVPSLRFTVRSRGGGLSGAVPVIAAAILMASPSVANHGHRSGSHDVGVGDGCWIAAPTVCADVTACPAVTSPGATVARFSVLPLPMIATVVDARAARDVVVARIGGLYGP